ncbi:MAG: ABC transporter permease [Bacteroidota bacterium]
MLLHYLTVAVRSLRRDGVYAALNVVGLAVALAACIVIGLFVRHERSYDRFFPNADRAYRVIQASADDAIVTSPPGLAQAMEAVAPEVEHAAVVGTYPGETLFQRGTEPVFVDDAFWASGTFFDVFPYRLVHGDRQSALDRPGSVVVTESLARRLFGEEDPMGRTLVQDASAELTVTGVMEDPPTNAHIRPRALVSMSQDRREWYATSAIDWDFNDGSLYLSLVPGSDPAGVNRALARLVATAERGDATSTFALQPVPEIHLHSTSSNELKPQSDVRYLVLFSIIGALILLIAGVNYVNLATARTARRAREVGVRRALGAGQGQIRRQFIGEAVVLCGLALPLAVGLAALALPGVNRIAGLELTLAGLVDGPGVVALLGLVLVVGVGAGLYPAVVLARLRPVRAIRGDGGARRSRLRAGLTTAQLAAAILLVVGTLVVQGQLDYVRSFRLGFEEAHVVTFAMPEEVRDQYAAFKQEALRSPAVAAVSSGPPMGKGRKTMVFPANPEEGQTAPVTGMRVDEGYIETMGLTIVAGRTFSSAFPTDSAQAVVITESAARAFGIAGDPLGEEVEDRTVVGVVQDVHNASLHDAVEPIVLVPQFGHNWTAIVRLRPGGADAGLADLERTWKAFAPERPFVPTFLEDDLEAQYRSEERLARVFGLFSGLALSIAALGLFGLVAHAVQQRAKEISVRKVLGATTAALVRLVSGEFVGLAAAALAVAVPLSLILSRRWLSTFAFHMDVGAGIFVLAAATVLAVVLLTAGVQAYRAAHADPVRALRSE